LLNCLGVHVLVHVLLCVGYEVREVVAWLLVSGYYLVLGEGWVLVVVGGEVRVIVKVMILIKVKATTTWGELVLASVASTELWIW